MTNITVLYAVLPVQRLLSIAYHKKAAATFTATQSPIYFANRMLPITTAETRRVIVVKRFLCDIFKNLLRHKLGNDKRKAAASGPCWLEQKKVQQNFSGRKTTLFPLKFAGFVDGHFMNS